MSPITRSQTKKSTEEIILGARHERNSGVRNAVDVEESGDINVPTLNDDCLLEIFSYLSMYDLFMAARNCSHRFRVLVDLNIRKVLRQNKKRLYCFGQTGLSFMKIYGECIHQLRISDSLFDGNRRDKAVAALMGCTSLQVLRCEFMDFSFFPVRSPIWRNIEKLVLIGCPGTNWKIGKIISACTTLKELDVELAGPITDDLVAIIDEHPSIKEINWTIRVEVHYDQVEKLRKLGKLQTMQIWRAELRVWYDYTAPILWSNEVSDS